MILLYCFGCFVYRHCKLTSIIREVIRPRQYPALLRSLQTSGDIADLAFSAGMQALRHFIVDFSYHVIKNT